MALSTVRQEHERKRWVRRRVTAAAALLVLSLVVVVALWQAPSLQEIRDARYWDPPEGGHECSRAEMDDCYPVSPPVDETFCNEHAWDHRCPPGSTED
jgi:hypothetical protein